MLKALLVKKLAVMALTFAATTAVPYMLMNRPVLSKVWGRFGPVIVDAATERIDNRLNE